MNPLFTVDRLAGKTEEDIDQNLICQICMDIVQQPKECKQCQTLFCQLCIQQWKQKNNKCPNKCPNEWILKEPHKTYKNTLNEIQFYCQYLKYGCKEFITFENYNIHEKECKFRSNPLNIQNENEIIPKIETQIKQQTEQQGWWCQCNTYNSNSEQCTNCQGLKEEKQVTIEQIEQIQKLAEQQLNQQKQSQLLKNSLNQSQIQKTGDWNCPNCNFLIFASKKKCFKCGTLKPQQEIQQQQQQIITSQNNNKIQQQQILISSLQNSQQMKQGDWNCPTCSHLVFASKNKCFKCGTLKPQYQIEQEQQIIQQIQAPINQTQYKQQQQQSQQLQQSNLQNSQQFKQGDWNCPTCSHLVFASKNRCFKCGTMKPQQNQQQEQQMIQQLSESQNQPIQQQQSQHHIQEDKKINNDWFCDYCKFIVYGSKDKCGKCNKRKPGLPENYQIQEDKKINDDWFCDYCKFTVYGRKDKCGKCGKRKPGLPENYQIKEDKKVFIDWFCNYCKFKVYGRKERCGKCNTKRPNQ